MNPEWSSESFLVARSAGATRLDPAKLEDLTLTNRDGTIVPLGQIGHIEIRPEDPILRRWDRVPTITMQSDIDERVQPPQVSMEVAKALAPLMARLPDGYRIELGGNIEESGKANAALAPIFPVMLLVTLLTLVIQTRSLSGMFMVALTAPLGLIGTVPIGQIHHNETAGLDPFHAVVEATVQRSRPVLLTALAAVLAFAELTTSVFWGSMAYVLVGGTLAGTVLILVFLPALYAIWHRVKEPSRRDAIGEPTTRGVADSVKGHA